MVGLLRQRSHRSERVVGVGTGRFFGDEIVVFFFVVEKHIVSRGVR
jgi:hypothetical protein